MARRLIAVSVFNLCFVVGCSAPPVKPNDIILEPASSVAPTDCRDAFVGVSRVFEWCSAIPTEQPGCECGTSQMLGRMGVFNKLSREGHAPSDVRAWYAILPHDYSVERVADWMESGIPVADAPPWVLLGRTSEETASLFRTGRPINEIKEMLGIGLTGKQVIAWLKTSIPHTLWPLWIAERIPPEKAADFTTKYELTNYMKIKTFLVDRRFIPVDGSAQPQSWICSRSNSAAQLTSVSDVGVKFIQRYEFIDSNGFPLEPMSFFDLNVTFEGKKLAYIVRRGSDSTNNWSLCPRVIESQLNDLYNAR